MSLMIRCLGLWQELESYRKAAELRRELELARIHRELHPEEWGYLQQRAAPSVPSSHGADVEPARPAPPCHEYDRGKKAKRRLTT